MSIDTWRGWKPPAERRGGNGQRLPTGSAFGACLRRLRLARGRVSQSNLAVRADFDHSYVSRLESGARMPTKEAVDRLADALALSDGERDELLASAGFLPRDVSSLLTSEPVIGRALDLLTDAGVSEARREQVRQGIGLLLAMAREG